MMYGTNRFHTIDTGAKAIEASRGCLSFISDRLFHPRVICAAPSGICSRIEDTIRFLSRNLEREERFMKEAGYTGFSAHRREHETLLRRLDQMKHTFVCNGYDNALVSGYLTEWTKNHTAAFDKPFTDFLSKHGMEPAKGGGY